MFEFMESYISMGVIGEYVVSSFWVVYLEGVDIDIF